MNFSRLAYVSLLPLFAIACASPASEESSSAASQDMTTEWLSSNIPPGSALEGKVLALFNDSTMDAYRFQNECSFTQSQAQNLIAYRYGDTSALTDDQSYNTLAEVDAVPYTDATFWANTVRCAMLHTPGPSVCVPSDTPPVILELVVDESGSMSGEKWDAMRDSLIGLFTKLGATPSNTLVGQVMFDDGVNKKIRPGTMTADHLQDLVDATDKPNPHGGGTGTQKALDEAFSIVTSASASLPGARRIVVLLSDGSPSGGDSEKTACIDVTTAAHARGIELYAVGIGAFPSSSVGSYDPAFMGHLAQVGGTAPASCNPDATDLAGICHVQITPGQGAAQLKNDLGNALETIRSAAQTSSPCP